MQKVAIIGASGSLGQAVLEALLSAGFPVAALLRASSKSKLKQQPNLTIIPIPDSILDCPIDDLIQIVSGQDALIITISGSAVQEQLKLADACEAAGVQRIIPADFGSCDSDDQATLDILPLYAGKGKVRRRLQELAAKEGSKLSWTSIIGGHFFDFGLKGGLLRFDVKNRKVELLDGGDVKFSATNLERLGLAVARTLRNPEKTKNRILYVQSVHTSQNELLTSLKRATGDDQWSVSQETSQSVIDRARHKADQGDADAVEEIVSTWGLVASDWEKTEKLSNGLLSLENEDLDAVVRRCVSELQ
ncbi:MAG: hypothetical protein M1821_008252 [Bathelium mastoideum]|nr:MAG: hypothetical protein M1821_008252 [Bathelium mastoideum]